MNKLFLTLLVVFAATFNSFASNKVNEKLLKIYAHNVVDKNLNNFPILNDTRRDGVKMTKMDFVNSIEAQLLKSLKKIREAGSGSTKITRYFRLSVTTGVRVAINKHKQRILDVRNKRIQDAAAKYGTGARSSGQYNAVYHREFAIWNTSNELLYSTTASNHYQFINFVEPQKYVQDIRAGKYPKQVIDFALFLIGLRAFQR